MYKRNDSEPLMRFRINALQNSWVIYLFLIILVVLLSIAMIQQKQYANAVLFLPILIFFGVIYLLTHKGMQQRPTALEIDNGRIIVYLANHEHIPIEKITSLRFSCIRFRRSRNLDLSRNYQFIISHARGNTTISPVNHFEKYPQMIQEIKNIAGLEIQTPDRSDRAFLQKILAEDLGKRI